jgi:hypothetical protein
MADLHIDDFYRDSAMILLRLHSSFPQKTILYVDDVSGPDTPDEFGLHSARYQACFSAMVWLAEAGYVNFTDTIRDEALDQAVLSQKGFLLLSMRSELELGIPDEEINDEMPPSVMESSMTNVMQLRRALREGSSIFIQQVMHYLLSESP